MFPSLSQIWRVLKNGFYLFPSLSKSWLNFLILKQMLLIPLSQSWLNFLILKHMLLLPLSQSWLNFPKTWLITRIARNGSNKFRLKEKQVMRVCLLHPCDFCKGEIRRECGEPMTDSRGFVP